MSVAPAPLASSADGDRRQREVRTTPHRTLRRTPRLRIPVRNLMASEPSPVRRPVATGRPGWLRGHARRPPAEHVVRRRRVAHVPNRMFLVRRLEDHRPRPNAQLLAVDERFDGAFADDQDLLLGVPMRGVRCLAGVQRRDMTFELVQRGRWRSKHHAPCSHGGGLHLHRVPIEDGRREHRRGRPHASRDARRRAGGNRRNQQRTTS